ncbi:MAG: DUF2461 domain-containing protein, partial [Cyclobacteriaceae bacterium]|nr:DUF2461 domain-containing protein [Cyclobacteriaceae bacterium]
MTPSLKPVFNFLVSLKEHNDRVWFNDHKKLYEESHLIMIDFAESVLNEMSKHDDIETASGKKSLFRIYRDVRFSKDKKPYKTSWSGSFKRATNTLRGGYYYHIEPGNTYIAGGFFGPNAVDLKHIRNHIDQDDAPLREILESKSVKSYFGSLIGEQVKTAPKGFDRDHASIDLLRFKQFYLKHQFSNQEVLLSDFYKNMSDGFQ